LLLYIVDTANILVRDMTYDVFGGTLNLAHSIYCKHVTYNVQDCNNVSKCD